MRVSRKVLAQQTGLEDRALEAAARSIEQSTDPHAHFDFRLTVRYQAHLVRGHLPELARELAAVAPDIYGAALRKTGESSLASAMLEDWICRYKRARDKGLAEGAAAAAAWADWPKLKRSELNDSECAVNQSPERVRKALARTIEVRDRHAVTTYRRYMGHKGFTVELAFLNTCRECGFGPGRAVAGRGVGLTELKRVLLKAGFTEVAGLPFRSPRARRKVAD